MNARHGFALLAVLWLTVALAALVARAGASAGGGVEGARARIAWSRARWAAEACLAAAGAALQAALRAHGQLRAPPSDTLVLPNDARCTVEWRDPAAFLNADSLGADLLARVDPAFHTRDGDGRVNLTVAPPEVLAALPGLGPEAIRVLMQGRAWARPVSDIGPLLQALSPQARAALADQLPTLLPLVTFRSERLVLHGRGWLPDERAVAVIEEVVVAAGERVATVQRRVW